MQGGCRHRGDCWDVEWLQGCRVAAGMQKSCRDGGGCRDGVVAEMGAVAGLQGCIDARWLQA